MIEYEKFMVKHLKIALEMLKLSNGMEVYKTWLG